MSNSESRDDTVPNVIILQQASTGKYIFSMVWAAVFFYGLFLAFSCGKADFLEVLGAFFLGPFYIAWKLATKCNLDGTLKAIPMPSFGRY